ncbi:MAG: threonylcarbamoyl-AMP synthase [Friedmanniella sp.]|nr:threonylcarbamoyl-AMP synthase [Friedmanniella sp.]
MSDAPDPNDRTPAAGPTPERAFDAPESVVETRVIATRGELDAYAARRDAGYREDDRADEDDRNDEDDAAGAFAPVAGEELEFGSEEEAVWEADTPHETAPETDPSVAEASYRRFAAHGVSTAELDAATEAARRAVEAGECIVLPTDTVYGIGADAFSPAAVQRLLAAKGRGRDMPPPVLIGDAALIRALAVDVPPAATDLVAAHWPGALTVIVKIQPSLRMDLGDSEGTIALRVPDHALARDVLRRTGPLAVSSANRSGQPAASTCDEAVRQLGGRVSVYLDGGSVGGPAGAPSTIVDFTRSPAGEVLRHGSLSLEVLRETVPGLRDGVPPEPSPAASEPSSAPSQPSVAPSEPPPAASEPTGPSEPPAPGSPTAGA